MTLKINTRNRHETPTPAHASPKFHPVHIQRRTTMPADAHPNYRRELASIMSRGKGKTPAMKFWRGHSFQYPLNGGGRISEEEPVALRADRLRRQADWSAH